MASDRQIAHENLQRFVEWIASKTDEDYRALAGRGVLSRKEIARECGFAKSALDQNPRIKLALRELEEALRGKPERICRTSETRRNGPLPFSILPAIRRSERASDRQLRFADLHAFPERPAAVRHW